MRRMSWWQHWKYWLWCKANTICWRHLCPFEGSGGPYSSYFCPQCRDEDNRAIEEGRKTYEEEREAMIREIRLARGE